MSSGTTDGNGCPTQSIAAEARLGGILDEDNPQETEEIAPQKTYSPSQASAEETCGSSTSVVSHVNPLRSFFISQSWTAGTVVQVNMPRDSVICTVDWNVSTTFTGQGQSAQASLQTTDQQTGWTGRNSSSVISSITAGAAYVAVGDVQHAQKFCNFHPYYWLLQEGNLWLVLTGDAGSTKWANIAIGFLGPGEYDHLLRI